MTEPGLILDKLDGQPKSYSELKEEYGNATGKNPLVIGDPDRLALALRYASFTDKEAEVSARRIAFHYLELGDFDSANDILLGLDTEPQEVIADFNNLYNFTGNKKYMKMKKIYLERDLEEKKDQLTERYIEDMRRLRKIEALFEKNIRNIEGYIKLERDKYRIPEREWGNHLTEMDKIKKSIMGNGDGNFINKNLLNERNHSLDDIREYIKNRTMEHRKSRAAVEKEHEEILNDTLNVSGIQTNFI